MNMKARDRIAYSKLRLHAHEFLAGVPLQSLYRLELKGGPGNLTIEDIKERTGFLTDQLETGNISKFLFWLRGRIGRIFGWDNDANVVDSVSFLSRLTEDDIARSSIEPGRKEGISRVMYCFENEFLAEIVNKTVHCFWVMAKEPIADGYALYMAVYVRKLNWFTPIYMAIVTPMLKAIIYPAMNKSVLRNWEKQVYMDVSNGKIQNELSGSPS